MRRWLQFSLSTVFLVTLLCAVAVFWWRDDLRRWLAPPQPPPTPLAFDGYCIVSMHQQFEWVRGDPRWEATYEDRVYRFASAAAKEAFLRNPLGYAAVLSGDDVVTFNETGKRVPGQLRFGAAYQSLGENGPRIYLFADEAALQKFEQDPEACLARLRQETGSSRASDRAGSRDVRHAN